MTPQDKEPKPRMKGPLAWMASNSVAANLLMFFLIFGGLFYFSRIKQEVFPQFELDLVLVNVVYPGASPAEIEQGLILAVEEAVRSVDGVKEIRSTANESVGVVAVELIAGTDSKRALSDVKSAIDRITTFPQDIERPVVSLATNRRQVVSLVVYGDRSERELRDLAVMARDELLLEPGITVAELGAVRPLEVSIEVPQEKLRSYGLTIDRIARTIREASVDVPGGGIKTSGGEVLVRTTERRNVGSEFEEITLLSRPDGTRVRVRDVATVTDGFRETDQAAFFNGQPAAMVKIYRVGDETPIEVSQTVKRYIERKLPTLPPGIGMQPWADRSDIYKDRIGLLLRNGRIGLILVLLCLGTFLNLRLAFWVTAGIPISFIGSLLLLPSVDVSINMISLFAYIITLGIVVDDAIIVGEAIYKYRREGRDLLDAAILGVQEVAIPVIFSILTTIVAFMPMLFVPGGSGKFFRVIPWIVIAVLLLSLVESLLILPAHLARSPRPTGTGLLGAIDTRQQRFALKVEQFIAGGYQQFIRRALNRRYLTMSIGVAILIATVGLVAGGRVNFTFLPKIESDRVSATLTMPFGTAVAETKQLADHIAAGAQMVMEDTDAQVSRGMFVEVGGTSSGFGSPHGRRGSSGSHIAQVTIYLVPSDQREITARQFSTRWREQVGRLAGIENLKFRFSTGAGGNQAPIAVRLSHADLGTLERASTKLAEALKQFTGVHDVDDGFAPGKEQLDLKLRPQARTLGLTENDMARQIRGYFFGTEAVRQQRGRDEIRAYVRLPRSQRNSEYDIERVILRAPSGGEIPLSQAAWITRGRSYTTIRRTDGRRSVTVSGDVIRGQANANMVMASLMKKTIPELQAEFPGLGYELGGQQRHQRDTLESLRYGGIIALIAIFGLLAVVFRSYLQPAIIMLAIPFGLVGAILGHVFMGYDLSMVSMMGIIALSGIVVNDSLILVVAINKFRRNGMTSFEASIHGAMRRFRPIVLTSFTTFFGLMPMILESSVQARFLIPMAVSLGFGVMFATGITLILVPATYLALEDAKWVRGHLVSWIRNDTRAARDFADHTIYGKNGDSL